ncbi:ABC transporter permease [Gulosibacter sp. 10]|uniref:ABC transporter permease n=1 Tax=Gulosibacter sp. 10 TaxID=1255570 RepID=UPI000B3520EA|nr:ABC transporter permease [Gulosibacter sp. 10]
MYGIDDLHEVTGRPPLGRYVKQLWQRRHFIWLQSRSRVMTDNDDSRLGSLWLIFKPLLDATFYWLIFGVLLGLDRGMDNFVAFIIIGVFMYQYTSTALSTGTKTISSSKAMIRAFQFPRMALPLADLVYDFLQRIPALLVMFVIIMGMPPHELPELAWLLFPVLLLLQTLLDFGLTLIFARLGTVLPDVSRTMPFLTRLLMYGSGVIFPIGNLAEKVPALLTVIELNPVYVLLESYRGILIDGTFPDPQQWITLSAWAVGLLIVGFFVFWQGEESYSRDQYK